MWLAGIIANTRRGRIQALIIGWMLWLATALFIASPLQIGGDDITFAGTAQGIRDMWAVGSIWPVVYMLTIAMTIFGLVGTSCAIYRIYRPSFSEIVRSNTPVRRRAEQRFTNWLRSTGRI